MNKKTGVLLVTLLTIIVSSACSRTDSTQTVKETIIPAQATAIAAENKNVNDKNKKIEEKKMKVASDNAIVQRDNPKMATRVIKGGTKINMHFGNTVIPGTLNDSETAQALIKMLPYTVRVNRYSHDFCGVMKNTLPYQKQNVHYGWLNGDIDFATDANYFTILFEDEEKSEQYGHQINIGKIDCELSVISNLSGSYDVLIELAK